jgi:hypothetical protein
MQLGGVWRFDWVESAAMQQALQRRRSTPSPDLTITLQALRLRGISSRKAARAWRSSVAMIPGPHVDRLDTMTPHWLPV